MQLRFDIAHALFKIFGAIAQDVRLSEIHRSLERDDPSVELLPPCLRRRYARDRFHVAGSLARRADDFLNEYSQLSNWSS